MKFISDQENVIVKYIESYKPEKDAEWHSSSFNYAWDYLNISSQWWPFHKVWMTPLNEKKAETIWRAFK